MSKKEFPTPLACLQLNLIKEVYSLYLKGFSLQEIWEWFHVRNQRGKKITIIEIDSIIDQMNAMTL